MKKKELARSAGALEGACLDPIIRDVYRAGAGLVPWSAPLDAITEAFGLWVVQFFAVDTRHLGVQANTVRTHLKNALAKTGTHRQSDLVRVLLLAHEF